MDNFDFGGRDDFVARDIFSYRFTVRNDSVKPEVYDWEGGPVKAMIPGPCISKADVTPARKQGRLAAAK
jgi:hypothetical protein